MGLGNVRDTQVVPLGCSEVLLDVTVGVYNYRFTGGGAPDEIARLGQFLVVDPLQEHDGSSRYVSTA
jgi:hypothetical protein